MPSSSCSFQLKHTHIHHPPLPSNHPNHPLLQSSQFRSLFRAILYRSLIQKQEKPWSLASKAPEEKTISLRFWQHWLLLSSPSSSSSASPLLGSKAMPHKGISFFFFFLLFALHIQEHPRSLSNEMSHNNKKLPSLFQEECCHCSN